MLGVPTFGIIAFIAFVPNNGRGSSNGCADAANCLDKVLTMKTLPTAQRAS
jgi:hypothetical protein